MFKKKDNENSDVISTDTDKKCSDKKNINKKKHIAIIIGIALVLIILIIRNQNDDIYYSQTDVYEIEEQQYNGDPKVNLVASASVLKEELSFAYLIGLREITNIIKVWENNLDGDFDGKISEYLQSQGHVKSLDIINKGITNIEKIQNYVFSVDATSISDDKDLRELKDLCLNVDSEINGFFDNAVGVHGNYITYGKASLDSKESVQNYISKLDVLIKKLEKKYFVGEEHAEKIRDSLNLQYSFEK